MAVLKAIPSKPSIMLIALLALTAGLAAPIGCSRNSELERSKAETHRRETGEIIEQVARDMTLVKGGCFRMGNVFGDTSCGYDVTEPVHEVCLNDFYIGKFEVTQGEWEKLMGKNPCFDKSGRLPVDEVSWNDVQEFIRKLNAISGKTYRLPTEAEWEYAARSGGRMERWAGTNNEKDLPDYAWCAENADGKLHLVGFKRPNGLGLYDMTGNVEEMVNDAWGRYDYLPQSNPQGPTMADGHYQCVIRGGGCKGDVFGRSCRGIRNSMRFLGFRLAMSTQGQ